jgi:hypothetical protein
VIFFFFFYFNACCFFWSGAGSLMVQSKDCEVLSEISATVTLVALLTTRVLVTLATWIESSGLRIVL